jgi:hypothetical protein
MDSPIPGRTGTFRAFATRRSVVAAAALLLITSLFVDVGVARAEYPAGWEDPDLMDIGACIGYCGTAFVSKGRLPKYSFGASCLGCIWKLFGDLYTWTQDIESDCYTGVLGQPCTGWEYEGSR